MIKLMLSFIMLFLMGCAVSDDSPDLRPGDCFSHGIYSKFSYLVIKEVPDDYRHARSYLTLTYNKVTKAYYFNFDKKSEFDPVRLEKCEKVKTIDKSAVKRMKYFNVWEDFKKIEKNIPEEIK